MIQPLLEEVALLRAENETLRAARDAAVLANSGPHFEYTPATDLHALGHLFYEALTGRAPYSAKNSRELMNAVLKQEPPPPSTLTETLPPQLDGPALRLLAKKPEDRTPSALVFAEELAEILANIPARAAVVAAAAAKPATRRARTLLSKAIRYARDGATYASLGLLGLVGVTAFDSSLGAPMGRAFETPPATQGTSTSIDAGTTSSREAKPPFVARRPLTNAPLAPQPRTEQAHGRRQLKAVVRATLVGHAQSGAAKAVLRQPLLLAALALPSGATLDGTADALPDGGFLLRFHSAHRPDGTVLTLEATALVDASAAARRPLVPGGMPPGFEFDLTLTATP